MIAIILLPNLQQTQLVGVQQSIATTIIKILVCAPRMLVVTSTTARLRGCGFGI